MFMQMIGKIEKCILNSFVEVTELTNYKIQKYKKIYCWASLKTTVEKKMCCDLHYLEQEFGYIKYVQSSDTRLFPV